MLRAPIALTCGDPSGIGLELSLKAFETLKGQVPFFLIGDPAHFNAGQITLLEDHNDLAKAARSDQLPVLQHCFAAPAEPGVANMANAQAIIDVISRGVDLVKTGYASALCTNPINKQVLKEGAGFAYPGHTEFLTALADVENSVMMLASDELRVVPATIHIALENVASVLTPDLLREVLRTTHAALQTDFGIARPRISVAGLNPHAGEGGTMGTQEQAWMAQLIKELQKDGMDVFGPQSADTMFHAAARQSYDAAVAMYHDQALIPIKTLAFDTGVNVTLGLPFVRTSPDHGTAFDIAGQDLANPSSLIEALKLAWHMVEMRGGVSWRK
ncbi:MAG: 4-hydroxythreonine-4-phosphate dehydrogenase PdxA [Pseudomonadota bacterium]